MQINFSTSLLEKLYFCDDRAIRKTGLPLYICDSHCELIDFLKKSEKLSDIWKFNGFNLEKYEDHRSMRLNDKWRVHIDFRK